MTDHTDVTHEFYAVVLQSREAGGLRIIAVAERESEANAFCAAYKAVPGQELENITYLPVDRIPADRNRWNRYIVWAKLRPASGCVLWVCSFAPVLPDVSDERAMSRRYITGYMELRVTPESRDILKAKAEAVPLLIEQARELGYIAQPPNESWMQEPEPHLGETSDLTELVND